MIKLFRKKTPLQKLEKQYDKLIQESYKMSTINRAKSDTLAYEANEVLLHNPTYILYLNSSLILYFS